MRWLVVLVAMAMAPLPAAAAISFVDENTSVANPSTSETPTEPTGAAEGDIIVCFGTHGATDGSWTDPADFTELDQVASAASADMYIGYKIRGADAGNGYTFSYSGTGDAMRVTCLAWTGDAPQLDVTYVRASHHNSQTNDAGATAAPAITTNTNGAVAVIFQHIEADGAFTQGVPTGYTSRADHQVNDRVHQIVEKSIVTATTETPGAWNHTDVGATADSSNFTIAIGETPAGATDALYRRRR